MELPRERLQSEEQISQGQTPKDTESQGQLPCSFPRNRLCDGGLWACERVSGPSPVRSEEAELSGGDVEMRCGFSGSQLMPQELRVRDGPSRGVRRCGWQVPTGSWRVAVCISLQLLVRWCELDLEIGHSGWEYLHHGNRPTLQTRAFLPRELVAKYVPGYTAMSLMR